MTFVVAIAMPKGVRPMTELEIGRLKWGQLIDVLDTHSGAVSKCSTIGDAKDGSVTVKFRGGHTTTLGAVDTDGQFVPVTTQLADELGDPNNALAVAIRFSNEVAKLKSRIRLLEEALHRQANTLQAQPTREQYDAIVADVHQLQKDYRILAMARAS